MASDLIRGWRHVQDNLDDVEASDKMYDGDPDEVFFERRLEAVLGGKARQFLFNIARQPVTSVLDRLQIARVEVGDDKPAADRLAETRVDNDIEVVEDLAHEMACARGDSYLLVWPNPAGGIDVTVEDAKHCAVMYDPARPQTPAFGVKTWTETVARDDERVRVNLYYADRIEKWVSKEGARDEPGNPLDDESFEEYVDAMRLAEPGEVIDDGNGGLTTAEGGEPVPAWPVPNPYRRVPMFHFRTSLPYGRPANREAWGPQRLITKIVGTHPAVIETAGWPVRIITQGSLESSEANDFDEDDDDTSTGTESKSRLRATPGSLLELAKDAKWGQFDPANPDALLAPFKTYIAAAAALSDTPHQRFLAGTAGVHPSEGAQRESKDPHTKKVERIQRLFGSAWRKAYELILLIEHVDERVLSVDVDDEKFLVDDPAEWWTEEWMDRVDDAHDEWDDQGRPAIGVVWAEPAATGDGERASSVSKWHAADAMSIRERVRARRPDWTDEEVDAEVVAILAEQDARIPTFDTDGDGDDDGPGDVDPPTFSGDQ